MGPSSPLISATPYPVHVEPINFPFRIYQNLTGHTPSCCPVWSCLHHFLPGLFLGLPALNLSLIVPILLKLTQVCLICSKPCNGSCETQRKAKVLPATLKAQHGLPSPHLLVCPSTLYCPPLLQPCCSPGTPATFPPHSLCTCWSLSWKQPPLKPSQVAPILIILWSQMSPLRNPL